MAGDCSSSMPVRNLDGSDGSVFLVAQRGRQGVGPFAMPLQKQMISGSKPEEPVRAPTMQHEPALIVAMISTMPSFRTRASICGQKPEPAISRL